MTKELSTYIYKKMIKEPKNYQWRIVSNSHKRAVEIYLVISAEISPSEFVQDVTAQINDEGKIYFEELVCFYDKKNNKIVKNNYLNAVPVDPTVGIEKGYVDAFLKQLNIRLSTAKNQLEEFLQDDKQKEFSLTWNEENMINTVKTLKKIDNYSNERLFFSTTEKSFVDKFKGGNYDGLERI